MPSIPSEKHAETTKADSAIHSEPHVLVFWDGVCQRRPLKEGATIVVGRGEDCDVRVVHPSLSRRHVAIHGKNQPLVEDLGSTNGVRVGTRKLVPKKPEPLLPGQTAEAGPILIVVQGVAPAAPETAATASSMQEVRRLLGLAAKSSLSIVLLGETGCGKEVAAEAIHTESPRAGKKLVRLNCAAFTESLLESELFGYERGAFTGAVVSKPGLIESGDGGTVFFDEVGELPPSTQVKLLRVLENREVRRIGGMSSRTIDVRFVCATNRDLRQLVVSGAFREDLFYRLNGMTIRILPLRERRDEIESLAKQFVAAECDRSRRPRMKIDQAATRALLCHAWPGNVRELRNVMERAVMLAPGEVIGAAHLALEQAPSGPTQAKAAADGASLRTDVDSYERERVREALDRAGGNQTKAAALLGLTRRALIGRLEAHKLPRPRKGRTNE